METKGWAGYFLLKRLAGFQLSEMQLCPKENLLWAKSSAGGFGKKSQNKAFQGKKKAFKNSLEAIFIPKSGRGRVTLIFHLLSPLPTERERGRWFTFSLLFLLQMQEKPFSPKLAGVLCAGTAVGTSVCTSYEKIGLGEGFGDQEIICGWPNEGLG